jgi:hypothetical protein
LQDGFGILTLCRYAALMSNRFDILWLSMMAASLAATMSANSAEKRVEPKALPGVRNDYRIVRPMVPEPQNEPSSTIKVDGWEVSVSGTVTVDITTGNLPLPRH